MLLPLELLKPCLLMCLLNRTISQQKTRQDSSQQRQAGVRWLDWTGRLALILWCAVTSLLQWSLSGGDCKTKWRNSSNG